MAEGSDVVTKPERCDVTDGDKQCCLAKGYHDEHCLVTDEQAAAVDRILELFDGDYHKVCEAMGMMWDGNMGWNG